MWPVNETRPDIGNAVRAVAKYANQPREVHWRTAIGILEYVFFTSNFGNTFQTRSGRELVAFEDADYASKAADRSSVIRCSYNVCGRLFVLVFENTEMHHALDHLGRVCSTGRHH